MSPGTPATDGDLLEALGEGGRRALEAAAARRHWPRGAALFREGDVADRVLLILEGAAKIVATSAGGTEAVLAIRGPGELVGELAAIDGRPRSAAAVATTPVTALAVPATVFRELLLAHPPAALVLLEVVVTRLRDAERKRAEFGSLGSAQRVAQRLAEMAEQQGSAARGGGGLVVRCSQEELAGLVGASREAVARALRSLRAAGLVETGRRRITVRDPAALRRWSD